MLEKKKSSTSEKDLVIKPVTLKGKDLKRISPKAEQAKGETPAPDVHVRPALTTPVEKRRQLAELLWGQPEFDTQQALRPPIPSRSHHPESEFPEVSAQNKSDDEGTARRVSQRRECNFPGLLRVMIPELTFSPRAFAIRLTDISPHGARIVTRQLSESLVETIGCERRYARLEVMIPAHEKLVIAGRIAWMRFGPELSQIGFQFEKEFPQADELFSATASGSGSSSHRSFDVPAPRVDSFPAITGSREYLFSGSAPLAEMILVRNGIDELKTPVKDGRFEVPITLTADRSNFLSFTSLASGARSIPTPVCIVHRTGAAESTSVPIGGPSCRLSLTSSNKKLTVQFAGTPQQVRSALAEIEQACPGAQKFNVSIDIEGDLHGATERLKKLATEQNG